MSRRKGSTSRSMASAPIIIDEIAGPSRSRGSSCGQPKAGAATHRPFFARWQSFGRRGGILDRSRGGRLPAGIGGVRPRAPSSRGNQPADHHPARDEQGRRDKADPAPVGLFRLSVHDGVRWANWKLQSRSSRAKSRDRGQGAPRLSRLRSTRTGGGQHCLAGSHPRSARTKSAQRSPIMIDGALVFPDTSFGMIDASATYSPSTPRTRSCGSHTAAASEPIRAVPTG